MVVNIDGNDYIACWCPRKEIYIVFLGLYHKPQFIELKEVKEIERHDGTEA
jgi:hypothetical protein